MITNFKILVQTKGSYYLLRAHGKGGASATLLSFLSVPPLEKSTGGFLRLRLLASDGQAAGWQAKKVRTAFSNCDKEQTPPSKLYELSHMHRGRGLWLRIFFLEIYRKKFHVGIPVSTQGSRIMSDSPKELLYQI